jgi:hypothetical protein
VGSHIELNDTLKLTREQGFPNEPVIGRTYDFEKPGKRLYHLKPVRVILVRDIDGRWDFVGHAQIGQLTIDADNDITRGTFVVTRIYPRDYAALCNINDAPDGKGLTSASSAPGAA